jgi:MFS superfamily sulfate permease-like transporter
VSEIDGESSGQSAASIGLLAMVIARVRGVLPRRSDYADLRHSWRGDLVAGVTVGVVALPLALAFGITSGLGADAGLITAIVAGLVAAIFGGSNVQVAGPTGAMTVVLVPIVARHGVDGRLPGRSPRRVRHRRRRPRGIRPLPRVHTLAGDRGVHRRDRGHHLPAAGARALSASHALRARTQRSSRRESALGDALGEPDMWWAVALVGIVVAVMVVARLGSTAGSRRRSSRVDRRDARRAMSGTSMSR